MTSSPSFAAIRDPAFAYHARMFAPRLASLTHAALAALAALTACGNSGTNKLADAPIVIDDAPVFDAPPARVTVHVTLEGSAAPGVVVYFLNADSSVVSDTTTDSDGSASALMAAGGSVTVIEPQAPETLSASDHLDTIEGVQPGDLIPIDVDLPDAGFITFSLVVPTDATAGVATYHLSTSCGAQDITPPPSLRAPAAGTNNAAVTVGNLLGCNGVADMLVSTHDSTGAVVDWFLAPAVAVTDGATVTLTNAYRPAQTLSLAYSGLPSTVTRIDEFDNVLTTRGVLSARTFASTVNPVDNAASFTAPTALPAGSKQLVVTDFTNTGVFDSQEVYQWGPVAATYTLTGGLLQDFTTQPALDITNQQVTWSLGATGNEADAVYTEIDLSRTTAGVPHTWFWSIVASGVHAGAVPLPTLPTDVFAYNPIDGDGEAIQFASTVSAPGGYDALRPYIDGFDPNSIVTGPDSGTVLTTFSSIEAEGVRARRHARP